MASSKKSRSHSHGPRTTRPHHPDAAGNDIGGSSHYVAVPADRDAEPVRSFGPFTEDLSALADWLSCCRITTVAMEATGVYLDPAVRNSGTPRFRGRPGQCATREKRSGPQVGCDRLPMAPGTALDGIAVGLVPPVRSDRCAAEPRTSEEDARRIRRIPRAAHPEKALVQMNLQLQNVVTDVTGVTGMKIIRDMLSGERDPKVLAAHRDYRCKSTIETIEKRLIGNWRDEHLFTLRQAVELNDFYERQIAECDGVIAAYSATLPAVADLEQIPPSSKRRKNLERNEPQFDARGRAYQLSVST